MTLVDSPGTYDVLEDYYRNHENSPGVVKFFLCGTQLNQARQRRQTAAAHEGAGAGSTGPPVSAGGQASGGFPSPQNQPLAAAPGKFLRREELRPKSDSKYVQCKFNSNYIALFLQ